jgi:hypothetical protein
MQPFKKREVVAMLVHHHYVLVAPFNEPDHQILSDKSRTTGQNNSRFLRHL